MMETLEEEWKWLKPLILDYECIFNIRMKLLLWENNQEMNGTLLNLIHLILVDKIIVDG